MNILETNKIFESRLRIQILASLSVSSLTYKKLKEICHATDGNMYTHLTKLLDEKYITQEKSFSQNKPLTTYTITTLGLKKFKEYIDILNNYIK